MGFSEFPRRLFSCLFPAHNSSHPGHGTSGLCPAGCHPAFRLAPRRLTWSLCLVPQTQKCGLIGLVSTDP